MTDSINENTSSTDQDKALLAAVEASNSSIVNPATGLLPDGSHPATPGVLPIYSAPAPQEAPTKATKAIWGAIASGVVAAATSFQTAATNGANFADPLVWLNVVVAGLVGAGIIGSAVYGLANKPK